jgi:S-DNA-T family DNA segregation ATPase FtsK/SpoIIIE
MARKDNKTRLEPPVADPGKWSNEIIGIALVVCGLLLLLALVSYHPSNLPGWGILQAFAAEGEQSNFIGPVGGVLAFLQYLLFGAAAWMLPVGLLWFGACKMLFDGVLWPRCVVGLAGVLLAGACFLHAADWFFVDWAQRCKISTANASRPGGLAGELLGGILLTPVIGRTGTLLLCAAGYLIALILLTGNTPVRFAKCCASLIRENWAARRQVHSEAARLAAREAEVMEERERQREARRAEREAAARAKQLAAAEEDPQTFLPLQEIPPPQIIDASQRRAAHPELAGPRPFERKKPAHQSPTITGFEDYELPGFDLLDADEQTDAPEANRGELLATQLKIIECLKQFGIEVSAGDITRGPTITRYEIYPSIGLRVSRITQLEADIARATCAERINILAPIPGKDTVGIELANSQKVSVPLHELLHDPEFRSAKKKIPLALGKDVYGNTVIGDLAAMPHLLVAGATGSGKSVCINSIISSILFKFAPDELRFIMVDPKVVEMQMYNKLPHMVVPVVTEPKKTVAALKWVVNEMEKRYRIFAKEGVRNFDSFNNRPRPAAKDTPPAAPEPEPLVDLDLIESIATALEEGELAPEADEADLPIQDDEIPDRFPYIVVLIDELADLMQTAPADVEMCIARIAQKARAAGIHLIIATQTPRADVVTGIIKANIPCRIAFQVSSALDSRVILDTKGAEKLVGKGDMLYLPPGSAKLERAQGAYLSDAEVERIVAHCAAQGEPKFETDIVASLDDGEREEEDISAADEETIIKCIEVVRQEQKASTSLLQRRLRLGYTRAARIMDIMEQRGVIGPGDGAKPREVFIK